MDQEYLWVTVALILFLGLVFWKGRNAILQMLDKRTARIRAEIEEATRLREEAQALLAEYTRKLDAANKEAEAIIAEARTIAAAQEREAAEALEALIARRRQQALDKIGRAEADAVRQVRSLAVDIAVAAARDVLASQVDEATNRSLVDQSIRELPQRLN